VNQQNPQQNVEPTSKITNPERIGRIVARMCDGRMQALIRTKDNSKVGIRASFARTDTLKGSTLIQFEKISNFGLQKLDKGMQIKVEVIGMPSKVMFVTEIKDKLSDGIVCSLPASLVSIERRQNARYRVTNATMAYLSFSVWQPEDEDPASPPFFDAYRTLATWIPILDMSTGGVCIQSHFPSFINVLESIAVDTNAKLHLPMSPPMPVHAAIRWKRRIRNRIIEDVNERYQLDFRIGVEFLEIQEEQRNRIRNFLRQLSVADAI
jgi:c-di-GMP-binding flagellar brake protein YcgR